ncbi:MAG: enoyl-CoA hydratase/isomerase family protein, partial [Thermoplasmata archaeon]
MSALAAPPDPVRLERRGPVGLLWLDEPPVNVLSAGVLDRLAERLEEADRDPTIRVLILASARERAFAAGANIREMATMGPAQARVHGARGQAVTVRIERLPIPVIAAVHGICVGGGCEIALACDFIVASEDALFGQPEINLGVMPGWGGTRRLPRRIGSARGRWWIYSGETVGAAEAL